MTTASAASTFAAVSSDRWRWLGSRRVFFGHQSVGANIMRGVEEVLRAHPAIPVRMTESADPRSMRAAGLYHGRVGTNGVPQSKIEAWERVVAGAELDQDGIALLKLCYVDITSAMDLSGLFDEYGRAVRRLKAARPGLTIVHVTTPVTADPGWLRHHAARLRGLTSLREVNLPRARYNDRMRETYGGVDPIFDLEALEASDADGRELAVRCDGRAVPYLNDAWTDDGGHLNEAGQTRAAKALLARLASLAPAG